MKKIALLLAILCLLCSSAFAEALPRETASAEAGLGPEDWQYLYRHCPGGPRKAFLARKIAELGGKGQDP